MWDGTRWNGAGAFSLNIDPDTLAKKTDLTNYLPLTGGTITGPVGVKDKGSLRFLMLDGGYYYISVASNGNLEILNTKGGYKGLVLLSGDDYSPYYFDGSKMDKLLLASKRSVANGVASLDANGKVPAEQIPVATASALGGVKVEFDETTGTLNIKTE